MGVVIRVNMWVWLSELMWCGHQSKCGVVIRVNVVWSSELICGVVIRVNMWVWSSELICGCGHHI